MRRASLLTDSKLLIVNNPNNPTGVPIPTSVLDQIVEIARARHITILSDEVYRPLFQNLFDGESDAPPSMSVFDYDRIIVTGSMSKAYALAGIRTGWIACRDKNIVKTITGARDYTTISVSQLDDQVATFALSKSVLPALLRRNVELARVNLELLSKFVARHESVCSWVQPTAGTTAFIRFEKNGQPIDDLQFCIDVINETKVFMVPGSRCFGNGQDFAGYVRIGYVCHTDILREALERLGAFVGKNLAK